MRSVIARVIRNTRVQDTSYILDMHEWIWEAMNMMRTQQIMEHKVKVLHIDFHKAKLPSGLDTLDAVQFQGYRLPMGNGVRSVEMEVKAMAPDPMFQSLPQAQLQKDVTVPAYKRMVETVKSYPVLPGEYYKIDDPGYITTSFAEGDVVLYYQSIPVDEDGMPKIPDNENYKQAIYWYVRAMMIGAGFQDKTFTYDHCFQQFEQLYAPRAVNEIRYPSPDKVEQSLKNHVRLLPNAGYYDSFFRVDNHESDYRL